MDSQALLSSEIARHKEALSSVEENLGKAFADCVDICASALQKGGKIIFFGNGGSASDAQHLATELTVRYTKNRQAFAALSLSTDTSALTAIGNDFGFDDIFSRQIEALCRPEDVAIGISTSGTSPNVIKGLKESRKIGAKTIGFGGKDGGVLPGLCDVSLIVGHSETARIQEMHILLGHALCQALEDRLGTPQS